MRGAIAELPESSWRSAVDGDGDVREGAQGTELTDQLDLSGWPEGTRLIVRRERPHPGAQLSVLDCETGYRHTAFSTDQDDADVTALELRHHRRARVEDAIRVGKETGMAKTALRRLRPQRGLVGGLTPGAVPAALGRRCSAWRGRSRSPSPSRCASVCCTSPGAWCARVAGRRCDCRAPGPGPWRCGGLRAVAGAAGCEPVAAARFPVSTPSPHLPIPACPRTGDFAPIRRRPTSKGAPGRLRGTTPAPLPTSSSPSSPC